MTCSNRRTPCTRVSLILVVLLLAETVEGIRRLPSDLLHSSRHDRHDDSHEAQEGPAAGVVEHTEEEDGGKEAVRRRLLESAGFGSSLDTAAGTTAGIATAKKNQGRQAQQGQQQQKAQEKQKQEKQKDKEHRRLHWVHHEVTSLPLLNPTTFTTPHYSGHLPAGPDPDDKKLFYWLFAPDDGTSRSRRSSRRRRMHEGDHDGGGHDDGDDGGLDEGHGDGDGDEDVPPLGYDTNIPLIIWLNGGPGCSSMDGLFLENGPFRLTKKDGSDDEEEGWEITTNPHSWHTVPSWTLYVDQPVGTGLSYTAKRTYCKNDSEVNADFHYFLTEFLKMYGDIFLTQDVSGDGVQVLNRPLYFSGESHAGHYIPSMMSFILTRNDDAKSRTGDDSPEVIIPISGAAIGNGWVDPYHQYAAATAAYGAGLIDLAQKAAFDQREVQCQSKMDGGNLDAGVCFKLLDDIVAESHGKSSEFRVSQYDVTKWERKDAPRTFPPGHKDVESYLGGWDKSTPKIGVDYRSVLEAIHATDSIAAGQRYQECTDPPFDALRHQDGLGVVPEVVACLDHRTKPKMLFFNGMNDLICNHAGNERFLDVMPWRHAREWTLAERYVWDGPHRRTDSRVPPGGYVKQFDNLIFLKIPNSGHMVPMDQPEISLDMMRTLVLGGTFQNSGQKIDRADPRNGIGDSCEPCPDCPEVPQQQPQKQTSAAVSGKAEAATGGGGVFASSSSSSTSKDDNDSFFKAMVTGGIMGAVAAFFVMGLITVIRRRRQRRLARMMALDEEENEEFDLHLEMNGVASEDWGNGRGEFRDDPIGDEQSNHSKMSNGSSTRRTPASRSSSRGEII